MKDRVIENLRDAIELIDEIDSERANREIHTFEHDGDSVNVLNGRYGPYISHKKKNYKIPKDQDPKSLTLEDCLKIISEAPKKTNKTSQEKVIVLTSLQDVDDFRGNVLGLLDCSHYGGIARRA